MTLYEITDKLQRAIDEKERLLQSELTELDAQLEDGTITKPEYDTMIFKAYENSDDMFRDTLEILELDRTEKIENIMCFCKNCLSDAKSLKEEADKLVQRQKQAERKAEWAKNYLSWALDGQKFECTRGKISFRRSERVAIDQIADIPEQFLKPVMPEASKTEIKKALKDGIEVPGAHLEENMSLIIK